MEFPLTNISQLEQGKNMGEIRVNLTNFITIGLMAFVFVYLANKLVAFTTSKMNAGG